MVCLDMNIPAIGNISVKFSVSVLRFDHTRGDLFPRLTTLHLLLYI